MQTTGMRTHLELVPRTFDRARTDALRSRRMVGETERRLAEALEIVLTLEADSAMGPIEQGSWAQGLDDAIRHLSLARRLLESLLSEERR
jgi:hypothetical protein